MLLVCRHYCIKDSTITRNMCARYNTDGELHNTKPYCAGLRLSNQSRAHETEVVGVRNRSPRNLNDRWPLNEGNGFRSSRITDQLGSSTITSLPEMRYASHGPKAQVETATSGKLPRTVTSYPASSSPRPLASPFGRKTIFCVKLNSQFA